LSEKIPFLAVLFFLQVPRPAPHEVFRGLADLRSGLDSVKFTARPFPFFFNSPTRVVCLFRCWLPPAFVSRNSFSCPPTDPMTLSEVFPLSYFNLPVCFNSHTALSPLTLGLSPFRPFPSSPFLLTNVFPLIPTPKHESFAFSSFPDPFFLTFFNPGNVTSFLYLSTLLAYLSFPAPLSRFPKPMSFSAHRGLYSLFLPRLRGLLLFSPLLFPVRLADLGAALASPLPFLAFDLPRTPSGIQILVFLGVYGFHFLQLLFLFFPEPSLPRSPLFP